MWLDIVWCVVSFCPFVRIWGIGCGLGISIWGAFFLLRTVLSRVLLAIVVFRLGIFGMLFLVHASGCWWGHGRSVVLGSARIVSMIRFVCPWGVCMLFRVPRSRVHVYRNVLASCYQAILWFICLWEGCCWSCLACGFLCVILRQCSFQCSAVSRYPLYHSPCSSCLGCWSGISLPSDPYVFCT